MLLMKSLLLFVFGLSFVYSTPFLTNIENKNRTDNIQKHQGVHFLSNSRILDTNIERIQTIALRKANPQPTHEPIKTRQKRSVSLASMVNCGATGSRKYLVSFGKYCGFGGSGTPVNEIDRCCKKHDECYDHWVLACWLPTTKYSATYNWYCDNGRPYCGHDPDDYDYDYGDANDLCDNQICQCDAAFVKCLNEV